MKRFPYGQRERDVREVQAAVHEAAREAMRHPNKDDAATQHWKREAARFHWTLGRAYPESLLAALEALKRGESPDLEPVLEFLEADPIFYSSGYMKEEALRLLPRTVLSDKVKERLRAILVKAVEGNGRREFRRYALIGRHIESDGLKSALDHLRDSPDEGIRRRAQWVLDRLGKRD